MNSLWLDSTEKQLIFDTLNDNLETQVCIVGAGIFGLTCAYYLSNLGYDVIVLEKDRVGGKVTGNTTAKITSQHGLFYSYLFNSYGKKFAKDYLDCNEQAIDNMKSIIDTEKIKCDFEYENNFVYTTKKTELRALKKEFDVLRSIDFDCEYVTKTGLPFEIEGSVCFKNQAQFNPLKYLHGLCNVVSSKGNKIFDSTTVYDVQKHDSHYIVSTPKYNVKSQYVIMANHYPFINVPGFYFAKMYQSTSYIIAVDPKKTLFNGMYINFTSPIFSYRTAKYKGKEVLLIGGGDHKTGNPSSYKDAYGILEDEARKFYPNCDILYKWNTRDCITLDKIPYIGVYSNTTPNMFIGTGFKKWGMTSSNVAANIIVDKIRGKNNKYSYLFDSTRMNPIKNIKELKNMLVESSNSILFNKLKSPNMDFEDIQNDSGSIVEINNKKVGIYKDINGNIYAVNPICTHLGCLLSWNDIDKTWDCPCHGSRFDFAGNNLYDPAFKNLDVYFLGNNTSKD